MLVGQFFMLSGATVWCWSVIYFHVGLSKFFILSGKGFWCWSVKAKRLKRRLAAAPSAAA